MKYGPAATWPQTRLADILRESPELIDVRPEQTYRFVTVRLWGKGVVLRGKVAGSELAARRLRAVRAGQFIFSKIDARNGALGLIPADLDGAVSTSDFPVFDIDATRLLPTYLDWLSKTPPFVDSCRQASEGTTNRVRLQVDRFLNLSVPLPPLREQRRIVARIEEVAGKVAETRLLRERGATCAELLLMRGVDWLLGENAWPEFQLGDLLREDTLNGLDARPSDVPPGVPILRISSVTSRADAIVDEVDRKYAAVEDRIVPKYTLQPGDLLACRFNGNLRYVGRLALFTGYSNEIRLFPDKLIRIRVDTGKALPQYVCAVMNGPRVRRHVEALCATTAGNIGISASALKGVPVPVPTVADQHRIVERLGCLTTKVAELLRLHEATRQDIDHLLPPFLSRAFDDKFQSR